VEFGHKPVSATQLQTVRRSSYHITKATKLRENI